MALRRRRSASAMVAFPLRSFFAVLSAGFHFLHVYTHFYLFLPLSFPVMNLFHIEFLSMTLAGHVGWDRQASKLKHK